jgi:hypothetical protein
MTDADKNFFNKIFMRVETGCFACGHETKLQSLEWVGEKFPQPKKQIPRSRIKTMLKIFFCLSRHSEQRIRNQREKE